MPLFLDRFPLDAWNDPTQNPPVTHWAVAVPVFLADPGLTAPPPGAAVQRWFLDTGHTGGAFAWRRHLTAAGLDPDQHRGPSPVALISSLAPKARVPVRLADLWLVSNVPALQATPYRVVVDRGIPFLDTAGVPDPRYNRPLLGMRTLVRAGLRVELDFAAGTVSVWTP